MQKIKPCLWFDDQVEAAASFYTSIFNARKQSSSVRTITRYSDASASAARRPVGSVMTVLFDLDGQEFLGLNGGPVFKFTPAVSLFVACDQQDEVDYLYYKLSAEGSILMELGDYPFSKRYGWVVDKFGMSWQIIYREEPITQKIIPSFLFSGARAGKAHEAMEFYTSIFPGGKIAFSSPFPMGQAPQGFTARGEFEIEGYRFGVSDSPLDHGFDFSLATSFMVNCDTQADIDKYWSELVAGGGATSQCGWLTDKFGVTWQIVPTVLDEIMQSSDVAKSQRAMAALMKMTKLDIAALQNA